MRPNYIAPPKTKSERQRIPTRALSPIAALPNDIPDVPQLLVPKRDLEFTSTHNLTTHIIPAAFPRAPAWLPAFPPPPEKESKQERSERAANTLQKMVEAVATRKEGYHDTNLPEEREILWTVVNRYARKEKVPGRRGITLLLAHAIGMHKEV
jgi:hypothetical protein